MFKSFKLSSASGPLGASSGNALWTSLSDFFSLPTSVVSDLVSLGGPRFAEAVDVLSSNKDIIIDDLGFPVKESPLRRLVSFGDKELKVRIVGILDYFSQSVLRGLHSYLFNTLKGISQDVTFNQGSFSTKFSDWDYFCSVDLTAATDRFPISVESLVLRGRFPDYYVSAWERVMVGLPFVYQSRTLKYGVGNPMGAYSSFASFALAHHYILYYCCQELGIS